VRYTYEIAIQPKNSPLHIAVGNRDRVICELLLEHGADVNDKDEVSFDHTVLMGGEFQTSVLISQVTILPSPPVCMSSPLGQQENAHRVSECPTRHRPLLSPRFKRRNCPYETSSKSSPQTLIVCAYLANCLIYYRYYSIYLPVCRDTTPSQSLSQCTDPNNGQPQVSSLFHMAVTLRRKDLVKGLLDLGFDASAIDETVCDYFHAYLCISVYNNSD
jgi:Ankyrin repeat